MIVVMMNLKRNFRCLNTNLECLHSIPMETECLMFMSRSPNVLQNDALYDAKGASVDSDTEC